MLAEYAWIANRDILSMPDELFRGISRKVDGIYRPNRIRKIGEGDPVRNTDIVVGSRLLENLRGVQLSNDLFADTALAEGNFKCIFARTCESTEQLQIFIYRVHV